MRKVIITLIVALLIGVLALEVVTVINLIKVNQYLPNIEIRQ